MRHRPILSSAPCWVSFAGDTDAWVEDVRSVRKNGKRCRVAIAALPLVLGGASPPPASAPEPAVKAAFLAKFAAYVDWPTSAAGQPLSLCIVGNDAFGRLIDQATAGQLLDGRPIVVRHIPQIGPASGCRIAYLAGSPAQSVEASLAALGTTAVLTVTDAENGSVAGMIHFELADRRVRFRIDQIQANAAGLTILPSFLRLPSPCVRKSGDERHRPPAVDVYAVDSRRACRPVAGTRILCHRAP